MTPSDIKLHKKTGVLELKYPDGGIYSLTAEFLRVHSPSAEVRGHGPGQEVLQTGKMHVKIGAIDTVGNYAIRLNFDDGHNTGIYSWEYLRELTLHHSELWQEYLKRLHAANARREPIAEGVQIVNIMPLKH
ncbi:MAG TPA: DUF971 domain-containing protein [Candidatus Acidoferrum sp.]|nr:DUF971 domain-containing protein [Candidatus Acidoferrum sp.]